MSIENNLKRIADALEALVASKAGAKVEAPKQPAPAPPVVAEPTQASPPVPATSATAAPETSTPPAPPVPQDAPVTTAEAAAPVVDSPEQCNALLIAEYTRLGGTQEVMQRILGAMESNFKVRSVNDLTKEQYSPLIKLIQEMR